MINNLSLAYDHDDKFEKAYNAYLRARGLKLDKYKLN